MLGRLLHFPCYPVYEVKPSIDPGNLAAMAETLKIRIIKYRTADVSRSGDHETTQGNIKADQTFQVHRLAEIPSYVVILFKNFR